MALAVPVSCQCHTLYATFAERVSVFRLIVAFRSAEVARTAALAIRIVAERRKPPGLFREPASPDGSRRAATICATFAERKATMHPTDSLAGRWPCCDSSARASVDVTSGRRKWHAVRSAWWLGSWLVERHYRMRPLSKLAGATLLLAGALSPFSTNGT